MEYARMREYAEELTRHAPDPFRGYEISGDRIILAMSAPRPHEYIALRVRQQLDRRIPAELVAHTGGEVEDPSLGRLRRPDLIVVPEEVFAETTMAPFTRATSRSSVRSSLRRTTPRTTWRRCTTIRPWASGSTC